MRKYVLLFLMLASFASYSQKVDIIQNGGGSALYGRIKPAAAPAPQKYDKVVQGSAYFSGNWIEGKVILSLGTVYDSLMIKLDLLDKSVHYIDQSGTDMTVSSPIRRVFLQDRVGRKEYTFDNSTYLSFPQSAPRGWYQVLAEGKASVYKLIEKRMSEDKSYGSATPEQTIITNSNFYLFVNSALTRVKKIKDLPGLLADKKEEMKTYISTNDLSGQSEDDFIKAITYYNSLAVK